MNMNICVTCLTCICTADFLLFNLSAEVPGRFNLVKGEESRKSDVITKLQNNCLSTEKNNKKLIIVQPWPVVQ